MVLTRRQQRKQQQNQETTAAALNETEVTDKSAVDPQQSIATPDEEKSPEENTTLKNGITLDQLQAIEDMYDKEFEANPKRRRRRNNKTPQPPAKKRATTKNHLQSQTSRSATQLPNEVIFEILSFLPVFPYYPSLRLLSKYFDDKFMEAMRSGSVKTLFPLFQVKLPVWFNSNNLKVLSLMTDYRDNSFYYNRDSIRELTISYPYLSGLYLEKHRNLEVLNVVVSNLDSYKWQRIQERCKEDKFPELQRINIVCYSTQVPNPTIPKRPEVEITFQCYAPVYIEKKASITRKKKKQEEAEDANNDKSKEATVQLVKEPPPLEEEEEELEATAQEDNDEDEEEDNSDDDSDEDRPKKKKKAKPKPQPKGVRSTPGAIAILQKLADIGVFYNIRKCCTKSREEPYEVFTGGLFDLVFAIAPTKGYLECFNYLLKAVGLPITNISLDSWQKLLRYKTQHAAPLLSTVIEERKQQKRQSVPDDVIEWVASQDNSSPYLNSLFAAGFKPTLATIASNLELLKEPKTFQLLLKHGLNLKDITEAQLTTIVELPAPHALPLIASKRPDLLTKTITATVGDEENSDTITAIPLYLCIYIDCNNLVPYSLIAHGSPLDYIHEETGNTLLHAAISTGEMEIARLLLHHLDKQEPETPSDQEERLVTRIINKQNLKGQSCLILACMDEDSLLFAKELLSYGANKDLQDNQGMVAFEYAEMFSEMLLGTDLLSSLRPSATHQRLLKVKKRLQQVAAAKEGSMKKGSKTDELNEEQEEKQDEEDEDEKEEEEDQVLDMPQEGEIRFSDLFGEEDELAEVEDVINFDDE